jgi:hypothetical protein
MPLNLRFDVLHMVGLFERDAAADARRQLAMFWANGPRLRPLLGRGFEQPSSDQNNFNNSYA